MRALSFVVFIIGCILLFSETAEVLGGILMALGLIMNISHHISNARKR